MSIRSSATSPGPAAPRILFLGHVPVTGSGSGIHLLKLTQAARGHGCQTLLVAPAPNPPHAFVESIGHGDHTGDWRLPFPFPSFSGHAASGLTYADLSPAQVEEYQGVWRRVLTDLSLRFAADIVHVNHAFIIADCVREVMAAPYVVVSHGSEFLRGPGERFNDTVRRALAGAAQVVAVSDEGRCAILQTGAVRRPVRVINPGFDEAVFRPDVPFGRLAASLLARAEGRPIVGCVGRLARYKRTGDVLHALAALPAEQRPLGAVIGGGPDATAVRELAEALRLDVAFYDHQDEPREVAGALRALSLLVVASEADPYPMAAIEALACGVPVVCSRACGVADRIVAYGAGQAYAAADVLALSALISQALTEDWRSTRGSNGPASVAGLGWGAIGRLFQHTYAAVLTDRNFPL